MQSVLKGAGKQAIKAAIVRGSKAVGVYGFVGTQASSCMNIKRV